MTGGEISGNESERNGGGVYVFLGSTFTIEDGEISGNTALDTGGGAYVDYNCVFTMEGGKISNNSATSAFSGFGGGGVYLNNSEFTIIDGEISNNSTTNYYGYDGGKGGGVFADYNCVFIMEGGKISGNTANSGGIGGGVYVYSADTFLMKGGEISGNSADAGGGVYARYSSLIMEGGEISGNTAERDGGGIYTTDYSKLNIANTVRFQNNTAQAAYDYGNANKGSTARIFIAYCGHCLELFSICPGCCDCLGDYEQLCEHCGAPDCDASCCDCLVDYEYICAHCWDPDCDTSCCVCYDISGVYCGFYTGCGIYEGCGLDNQYVGHAGNIGWATTSIPGAHLLNNYDINYDGENSITSAYTVTFKDHNGGAITTRQVVAPETTVGAAMPENPNRAGYVFAGWNTERNGSGLAFYSSTKVTGNIDVYATWRAVSGGGDSTNPGDGGYTDPGNGEDSGKQDVPPDTKPDTDPELATDPDPTPDTDSESDTDTDTDTNPEPDSESNSEPDSGFYPNPYPDFNTDFDLIPGFGPDSGSGSDSGFDITTGVGLAPGSGSEVGSGTTVSGSGSEDGAGTTDAALGTDSSQTTDSTESAANPSLDDTGNAESARAWYKAINISMVEGVPLITIGDREILLFAPLGIEAWALMNMILFALGAALAVTAAIRAILRKRQELKEAVDWNDIEENKRQKKQRKVWLTTTILMGIAGIFLFLLTQDTSNLMVLVDMWTIVNAAILAVEIIAFTFAFKARKESAIPNLVKSSLVWQ